MTSPAQRGFEAWYEEEYQTRGNLQSSQKDDLYEAYMAALASRDKLRDAVIVLEDGAEAKVGDFVYTWQTSEADSEWEHTSHDYVTITAIIPNLSGNGKTYEATKRGMEDCTYRLWGSAGIEILKRAGKPAIYRSEL